MTPSPPQEPPIHRAPNSVHSDPHPCHLPTPDARIHAVLRPNPCNGAPGAGCSPLLSHSPMAAQHRAQCTARSHLLTLGCERSDSRQEVPGLLCLLRKHLSGFESCKC